MKVNRLWALGVVKWLQQRRNRSRSPVKQSQETRPQKPQRRILSAGSWKQPSEPIRGIGKMESNMQPTSDVTGDRSFWRWLEESKGFVLACVAVALVAWMFRYDMKPSASPSMREEVYLLDRWTGNVYFVEVQERKDTGRNAVKDLIQKD